MPDKKAANDPHVQALGGFDVTALSVAELRDRGVVLAPRSIHEADLGERWLTHSEYAAQAPRHDDVDRAAARAQSHEHLRRRGKLAGLRLQRSFPCLGTFRTVLDDGRGPVIVQCDSCGDELGVARRRWERDHMPAEAQGDVIEQQAGF
jgi:hypothetical protein